MIGARKEDVTQWFPSSALVVDGGEWVTLVIGPRRVIGDVLILVMC